MLPKDFKLWNIFENTNGYLSLVYSDGGTHWYIINYNGTMYRLSKESTQEYNFVRDHPTDVNRFFCEFPMNKLNDYQGKIVFWQIHDRHKHYMLNQNSPKNYRCSLLLLIS
jgi:hypothetical protein